MITPAGKECRFYYEDFYRGKEFQECRLIARNPRSMPWEPALCHHCSVPAILRANACPHMALEARATRQWHFWKRVRVEAFCTKYLVEVKNPFVGCGHCHETPAGASLFDLPVAPDERQK